MCAYFPDTAIQSTTGLYCMLTEARPCFWSGKKFHPDDLRVCSLTGLTMHFEFITTDESRRLVVLSNMLEGLARNTDKSEIWDAIAISITKAYPGGRVNIEAAILSPDAEHIAVCAEVRKFLGLKIQHIGCIYTLK